MAVAKYANSNHSPKVSSILAALSCGKSECQCPKGPAKGTVLKYSTHCPAHDDEHPSLRIWLWKAEPTFKCYAGCPDDRIRTAIERATSQPAVRSVAISLTKPKTNQKAGRGRLTVETLAEEKQLPVGFLRTLGLRPTIYGGKSAVLIPYRDVDGNVVTHRYRLDGSSGQRFASKKGSRAMLYGLDRLAQIEACGYVLLVEGESDCWTAWPVRY